MEEFGFLHKLTFAPSPSTVVTFQPEHSGTGARHLKEENNDKDKDALGCGFIHVTMWRQKDFKIN